MRYQKTKDGKRNMKLHPETFSKLMEKKGERTWDDFFSKLLRDAEALRKIEQKAMGYIEE